MTYADLRIGRFSEPGRAYLVTTVVAGRRPIFTELYQARAFIRVLRATQEAGLGTWLAWVLMPDHFHGLVSLGDEADLATLMRELKGASARELNRRLGRRGGSGSRASTIMPCAWRRIGWRRPDTSWPIPCGRGWCGIAGTTRIGTASGCDPRAWESG